MADEKLLKLTELCVAFKDAAEARVQSDLALQRKIMAAIKPAEMEELMDMVQELAGEALSLAFGGEPSDEFLKLNIKACEKVAELSLRAMPEDTVRADMPADLKTEESAKALAAAGAPTLARLAGPR